MNTVAAKIPSVFHRNIDAEGKKKRGEHERSLNHRSHERSLNHRSHERSLNHRSHERSLNQAPPLYPKSDPITPPPKIPTPLDPPPLPNPGPSTPPPKIPTPNPTPLTLVS